ncbi:acyltransferase [Patescibacteria group bacterium]|nr:acyltransferase [Patescibacteria group bacterium]
MQKRIYSLDGLRGLAILAVIFTHIPLGVWYSSIPSFLAPVLDIILGSGGVGVIIFFILTGFLMGLLHPNPGNKFSFWSLRYARIFPAFLVMVFTWTAISLLGKEMPGIPIVLLILFVLVVIERLVWEVVSRLIASHIPAGKILMVSWLFIQGAVAFGYSFFLLRVPASVFYQVWSDRLRLLISGLINATMTLPFGQYVAQMDGVYWAIIAEVLFYLLYPLFFVPIFQYLGKEKDIKLKAILALSLLPFSYGLYLISQRVLGFEIVKIHLMIYFIAGTAIGMNLVWFKERLSPFLSVIRHPLWFLLLLFLIFGHLPLNKYVPGAFGPIIQILLVFPVSLLLLTLTIDKSAAAKFFNNRVLISLGKYSYLLFLIHTLVIHISQKYIPVVNSLSGIELAVVSVIGSIALSCLLYPFLEKPYFLQRKKSAPVKSTRVAIHNVRYTALSARKSIAGICTVSLVLLYIAYRPPLSLFTFAVRHDASFLPYLSGKKIFLTLKPDPIKRSFTAADNNLGMVTVHVLNKGVDNPPGGASPVATNLKISLLDSKRKVIAQTSYATGEIIDSYYHPFGFPVITNSKDRKYTLELQLDKLDPTQNTDLITSEGDFITVYFPDKKSLLRDPLNFAKFFTAKISEPVRNPIFWFNFLYIVPFMIFLVISLKTYSTVKRR